MARSTVLKILSFTLLGIVLVFQNCANPNPYSHESTTNSSSGDNPGNTTPRLTRPEDDLEFKPPDLSLPLPHFVQDSGTNNEERAWGLVQIADGGFISAGRSQADPADNTGMDVLFKKFDRDGVLVYSRKIGDAYENQSYKALELPDCYLVAGLTRTVVNSGEGRSADLLLVRINKANGDVIESFRYGTTDVEALHDLIYTRDPNGDVLVGVGYHLDRTTQVKSALVVKFNFNFEILWSNRFMVGSDPLVLQSVAYVPGGGYYGVGFRDRPQNQDSLIIKFSYAGAFQAARLLNNTANQDSLRDVGFNGTHIVAVGRLDFAPQVGTQVDAQGAIHRFDFNLNPISTHVVGRAGSTEQFFDVNTHPDGSLIMAGVSNARGNGDNWIVKVKPDFSGTEFSNLYGTNQTDTNQFHSMVLRRDYGYAFMTNNNNPARTGTMSPALLLLDQFGNMPAGCSYQHYNEANPAMTVTTNASYVWQNYNMTSNNVPLDVEPIDLDVVDDDPTSTNYCVN